jgi:hypothetical protein
MNGILELESLKLYSTSSRPSVSRRGTPDLSVSKRLLCKYAMDMSIAPQDLGMRWRRVSSNNIYACTAAPRPYGRFNPFLRLMAPAGQSKARMLAICGGFRSHLCFDDWTDLQRCRLSRLEGCEVSFVVVCEAQAAKGWDQSVAITAN